MREFTKARLRVFHEEELDVPIVLFNDVLDHILCIDRVSRRVQGQRTLASIVVGQPVAFKAVANAIRFSSSGLSNENPLIASFLFAGPSGMEKMLLSKALANILFDSPGAMSRIDASASEYSEIGAPPGYVGHAPEAIFDCPC